MAFHYITPGRYKPVFLLLTFVICFSGSGILAQGAFPDVTNVTILSVNTTSITVNWMKPTAGNITEYFVIVNNGSNIINTTTTDTSYTATGLLPGVTYHITIFSVYQNGTSKGVLKTQTTRLPDVTDVKIISVNTTAITVGWVKPTTGNIAEYRVIVSDGSMTVNMTTKDVSYTITGLLPGVTYNITIFSVNENSTSNGVQKTQTTRLPDVTDVKILSVNTTSITVGWVKPTTGNISEYRVIVSDGSMTVNVTTKDVSYTVTGLLPGVTYRITIFSVNANSISNGIHQTQTTRLPDVTDVKILSVNTTSITVDWVKPTTRNIAEYIVSVSDGSRTINGTTNIVPYTVTGLLPGVTYIITIFSVNENSTSNGVHQILTTRLPDVTDVKILSVNTTSITVGWVKPTTGNISEYRVIVSDGSMTINMTTKDVSYTVTGLLPGVTYNITIFSVNANSTSNGVQKMQTTRLPDVTDVKIRSVNTTAITVDWVKPTTGDIAEYRVIVTDGSMTINVTTKNVPYTVTSLLPGVTYNITIFSVNANITSNGVQKTQTTRPSTVTDFQISAVSENYINLSWTYPTDVNRDNYTYRVNVTGDKTIALSNITSNKIQVTGLSPGENYTFAIYTVTPNDVPSNTYLNPLMKTTMPSRVTNFNISAVSEKYVNLTWTFPNDKNSQTYRYRVEVGGDMKKNFTTETNYYQVTGLSPGENYTFTIYTVTPNDVFSSNYPYARKTTLPNKPGNLVGNPLNVAELFINWTAPEDPNYRLYDYQVNWINQDHQTLFGLNTTKNTNLTIGGLFPGNRYIITVVSVISNTLSAKAEIYELTNPLPPNTFTVLSINNTVATLTWSPPAVDNSRVSGYQVQFKLEGGQSESKDTTLSEYVLENLVPGNKYFFTIRSFVSSTIYGNLNRMDSSIRTYSTVRTTNNDTDPNPVSNLQCSMINGYQIRVKFNCPSGNYSKFEILLDNENKEANKCGDPDGVIVPNLQPAKSYTITVKTLATQKSAVTESLTCHTDSTGVIVGSIFGVLLFFLLIGLIVFFVMKKRRSKGQPEIIPTTFKGKRFHTIAKERFAQHYDRNHADSDFGFAEEYQELSSVGTTQSKRAAEIPENRGNNRFTNVLPYDHSRVKLSTIDGIANTDYINANYMPGYNSTKEFIASQGPLPNTTADFWRMIWEHQVNTIIMLTNCLENGRVKCDHYWPLDYTPCTYGDITVTVTSETILSQWTIRDFSVKHAKQPGIKYLRHFHFTAWPDHGVPDSTSSIIQFRNLVREHMDQRKSNGPTIVHCSAGVGRTGTLIALDYLIQQMEKEHRIGVYSFVEKMRMNRGLMVQTEAQYIFLNTCMLDLIEQPMEENIYENQVGDDLIYENASVVRNQRENA